MKLDKTKTPDSVYGLLPEGERITAVVLRELIFETLPEVREKLSWGAPCYFGKRMICFVWPASVPWGKVAAGVALRFTHPELKTKRLYREPEEIDLGEVQELLREAWRLDGRR